IKDVSKFTFSDNSLTGYIHAGSGVYSPDSGWEIMNTVSRRIKDNRTITVDTLGRETSLLADESPEKMIAPRLDIKDMSYWQTKAAIEKYKSHGKETKQYLSELHFKIAFPFMNFIVIILGISITASSHQKRQGMAVLFGIGLGFVFIYWISSQILLSFGKSGALPPITAAWLPNIVFFIISILFFRRAHR
ncbi:MAG: LptF/LptG family permease, partial [Chitinivibrionales bacterium]